MLVAIAGSIGAGKSTVAQAVSEELQIPFHSVDEDKRHVGASHPEFERWIADATPFPDDFRRTVFERTLEQLSEVAEVHAHAIIEETFHRAAIREPFLAAAGDLMGGLILVELTVTDEVAMAHLARRAEEEHDHMAGVEMLTAFRAVSDPIVTSDLIVANDGDLSTTVEEICSYLRSRL